MDSTKMTDKELLELAAKAAGIYDTLQETEDGFEFCGSYDLWNPLTDDGDALRLAVRLGLVIYTPSENSWDVLVTDEDATFDVEELCDDGPYAATRRCIVRAAAEIGKEGNE